MNTNLMKQIKSALICAICGLTFLPLTVSAENEKLTVKTTKGDVEVTITPEKRRAVLKIDDITYYYVYKPGEDYATTAGYKDDELPTEKQVVGYKTVILSEKDLKDPKQLVKIFDEADAKQQANKEKDTPPPNPLGKFIESKKILSARTRHFFKGGYITQDHDENNPNDPNSGWEQYEYVRDENGKLVKDSQGNPTPILTKSTSGMSDHGYGINLHDKTGYKYRYYYINLNKGEKLDPNRVFTPQKSKIEDVYDAKTGKRIGTEYYEVDFLKTSALDKKRIQEAVAEWISTPYTGSVVIFHLFQAA